MCYIYNPRSSFERNDLKILSKHYEVSTIEIQKKNMDWLAYRRQLSEQIRGCDFVFTWFANWHSYLAMRQCARHRKKLILVAGGYDVACVPEIKYGAWYNFNERYPAKRVLQNADLVISVSKSNQDELLSRVTPRRNVLVYNGADTSRFSFCDKKSNQVMCVVSSLEESILKRKGLDILLESARQAPDLQFYIVGKPVSETSRNLTSIASSNVHFTDFLSDEDLLDLYQKSLIYTQPSCHEGFGIAVVEAMLCGCVPVVSDRYALPEVVGDVGLVVPYGDPNALSKAFIDLTQKNLTESRKKARDKALFFSLDRREEDLVKSINDLMGG